LEVKFGLGHVLIIGVAVVGFGNNYSWFGVNRRWWLYWVFNANGWRELFGFNY